MPRIGRCHDPRRQGLYLPQRSDSQGRRRQNTPRRDAETLRTQDGNARRHAAARQRRVKSRHRTRFSLGFRTENRDSRMKSRQRRLEIARPSASSSTRARQNQTTSYRNQTTLNENQTTTRQNQRSVSEKSANLR